MTKIERMLVRLDDWPWSAAWRLGVGLAMPPGVRLIAGEQAPAWLMPVLFLVLLVAIRVGSALLRHALPFSEEIKSIWRERRLLAKTHDSYQWRKLVWFGLGLMAHFVLGNGLRPEEIALMMLCLVSGLAGQVMWSRAGTSEKSRTA